jgi:endonuclease YncB( thermonuclease family)
MGNICNCFKKKDVIENPKSLQFNNITTNKNNTSFGFIKRSNTGDNTGGKSSCLMAPVESDGSDWIERLKITTNDNVPDFSVNGICTLCKIVDVYDSDTFRAVFFIDKNDKNPIKMKVRAAGCNAAEMHPLKSHPDRKEEMRKAKVARNRLVQLITGIEFDIFNVDQFSNNDIKKLLDENKSLLYIEFGNFDKYGRVLGTLYLDDSEANKKKSINQILIDENHAVYYDGGKRDKNNLTVT